MKLTDSQIRDRYRYYNKLYVLFELVKAMRDREVVLMDREDNWKCVRGLFVRTVDFLKYVFNEFHFFEKDYNIYISSAKYRFMPNFTFNLKDRKNQTSNFFQNHAHRELYEYDALLDFDRKDDDWLTMFSEVKLVHMTLKQEKVCHFVIPSGNNFQIIIPSENFSYKRKFTTNVMYDGNYNYRIGKFVEKFKERFKLTTVDLKNNGVYNRVFKCPYSLVKTKVVLPLYTLEHFDYSSMRVINVLKLVDLAYRGMCYIEDNGTNNKKNMTKFLKKYYLEV